MNCRFAIFFLALVAALPVEAASRPNFIVILVDDLGWADLGCYGSRFHRTPNTDRLAAEGMRFTQAYSACPVCSPTRAALMTGRYPARYRLTDWLPGRPDMPSQRLLRPDFRQELALEEVTLAELLATAGYQTGTIGKWHLGGAGFEPTKQGFIFATAGDAAGSPPSYFGPYRKNGRSIPGLVDAPAGEYLTDRLFAEAERFLEGHQREPFLLYLPHYTVHTPLEAKAELVERYRAATPAGSVSNPIYAAMLDSLDQGIGRLLAKLDQLKLADNTVVVFTSDNGGLATGEGPNTPSTSNAPLRDGKGYLYEGGIRVPLLVRWPGKVRAGSVCSVPVCSIDFFPTFAELAGVPVTTETDGASLVPLLEEQGGLARADLYWHYPHYSNQSARPGGAIRSGDWKLIEFFETGRRELFNLKNDPSEGTNLAPRDPERVKVLAEKLARWRESVQAQAMRANPDYRPNPQDKEGAILLHARSADVHGAQLRYEPVTHKNTLGFWIDVNDFASWDFTVTTPGTYRLHALQGCGPGSGGSRVEFRVAEQVVPMTVEETKGFQDFIERELGSVTLAAPGRYTLTVKAQSKPGPAVMDLRQVRLVPETARK